MLALKGLAILSSFNKWQLKIYLYRIATPETYLTIPT